MLLPHRGQQLGGGGVVGDDRERVLALAELQQSLTRAARLAFDTETPSLDPLTADLVARTVDHRMTVIPKLDATLPIASTLAGGPVAGLAVLLAQKLMDKQVDDIYRFEYRISGPLTILMPRTCFMVSKILPGASPEVMESDVTDVIEAAVNTIEGIDQITSFSGQGVSQVTVTFTLERDIDIAAQDVRDKVSGAVGNLPLDAEPPIVQKLDINSQPMLWIALAGLDNRTLSDYADQVVKPRLQAVPGVGNVIVAGFREPMIRIWIDRDKLAAHLSRPAVEKLRGTVDEHASTPLLAEAYLNCGNVERARAVIAAGESLTPNFPWERPQLDRVKASLECPEQAFGQGFLRIEFVNQDAHLL